LIVSGIPVCLTCDREPEKTQQLLTARVELSHARINWKAAKAELTKAHEIMASLAIDHPDGIQVLKKANASLAKAGKEVHAALSEYLRAAGKK